MTQEIRVPALGENIDEVEVVDVLVSNGSEVGPDDIVVTLESDKAAMDLPAEATGVVAQVAVSAGDKVREGDLIAVLDVAENSEGKPVEPAGGLVAADTPVASAAHEAAPPPEQPVSDEASATVTPGEPVTREVLCPELGENIDSADVADISVTAGDNVEQEDPLITLETDKAAMDLPAPFAGKVVEIRVAVGASVRPGDLIALIETAGVQPVEDSSTAVQSTAPAETDAAESSPEAPVPAPQQYREAPPVAGSGATSHASPAIRKFARELGVDLAQIAGSGRKGRITRDDVQRYVKQIVTGAGVAAGSGGVEPFPDIDFSQWGEIEEVPLSRIRQLTGENLGRSWPQIPQVTQFDEADVTDLEAFRKATSPKVEQQGAKLTMVAILLKATAQALREFPDFNSSLHNAGESLIRKRYIHIGVAVDTEAGLVVPVVRDVDRKGLTELAVELADISGRARERKLKPDELSGSSFTISSLGGIGGTGFTPIVNWPNVAILGVARTQTKPVFDDQTGQFVPRLILPFSLSYDHRVIDGAAGVRFTRHLAGLLEDLRGALM